MAKKVLITGKDSYVGTSFIKWMAEHEPETECVEISVRGEEWKKHDFSKYDSILHVAGIAHQKETKKNRNSYFEVNHKLAVQVARKAKDSNIQHLIFLSSMSVYGKVTGNITQSTECNPKSYYGLSKFYAERDILDMASTNFHVSIVRPPMIYGEGCKGNYKLLEKAAKTLPIFPDIKNERSMIDIDILSMKLHQIMNKSGGIYHPQDRSYSCTSDIVVSLTCKFGKSIKLVKWFNFILIDTNITVLNKVFGDLTYSKDIDNEKRECA